MLSFTDKLFLSLISSFSFALFFSISHIYFPLPIPSNLFPLIELLLLSIPCFFFFIETHDAIFSLFMGFTFSFTKNLALLAFLAQSFCLFEVYIFSAAFFFLGLSIGFHREVALSEARMGLISTFALFFALIVSTFILLTAQTALATYGCPIFQFKSLELSRMFSLRLW